MKKIILFIIVAILILMLIIGINFYLLKRQQESLEVSSEAIISFVLKEDLNVEFGQKVKVSDFFEEFDGKLINDYEINTENLGEVKVSFEFIDNKNQKGKSEFSIKIIDVNSPQILIGNSRTVKVGYDKNLTNVLLSLDIEDGNLVREVIGDYDLNTAGDYNLTYVVTDSSGNQAKKDFVLKVREKKDIEDDEMPKVYIADVLKNHKTENTKIGIDVSKWEEEIDWEKVKNSGIEFTMIRMGYQTEYDGEYVIDPYFDVNIEGAKKVGLQVGVYFYSYAKSIDQAKEQAEWVKENLKNYEIDLPVAFDWESWNSFNTTGMSVNTLNNVANTFLKIIEEAGYKGMLYGSKNYLEKVWYPSEYDVWVAHYTKNAQKTSYEGKYLIWQLTETGRVDGIEDDVDIDVMYLE